jgi:hypothetical protein
VSDVDEGKLHAALGYFWLLSSLRLSGFLLVQSRMEVDQAPRALENDSRGRLVSDRHQHRA